MTDFIVVGVPFLYAALRAHRHLVTYVVAAALSIGAARAIQVDADGGAYAGIALGLQVLIASLLMQADIPAVCAATTLRVGSQTGTALRPARCRAMMVFMICAVPSPI